MSQKFKDVQKFADADFIKWAKRPVWSVREAIPALYGYKLNRNHTIVELINMACSREELQLQLSELIIETQRPAQADNREMGVDECSREERLLEARREILIGYCKYKNAAAIFNAPAKWVQRASYNGLTIAREWEAIFPNSVKMKAMISPRQEPDYREFIDCLTRNLKVSTRDIVCYGLNIHPNQFGETSACGDLLAHIYSELWQEEDIGDLEELRNKKVSVSWFLNHCQMYNYLLDAKFLGWMSWAKRHSKLVKHLSVNEQSQSAKARASKYDPVIQAVVDAILPKLARPTMSAFTEYFRVHEAVTLDVKGCDEAYFDGEALVCVDHDDNDRETIIKRRSIETYVRRFAKVQQEM